MARDFRDGADAGEQLGMVVPADFDYVVAVLPTSRIIAEKVAQALSLPLVGLDRIITDDIAEPVRIELHLDGIVNSARLLVVDDAVETGRTSVVISHALKAAGFPNFSLAVPVCPRDSEYLVRDHFEQVIAVVRPLMRRSLSWHYAQVPGSD